MWFGTQPKYSWLWGHAAVVSSSQYFRSVYKLLWYTSAYFTWKTVAVSVKADLCLLPAVCWSVTLFACCRLRHRLHRDMLRCVTWMLTNLTPKENMLSSRENAQLFLGPVQGMLSKFIKCININVCISFPVKCVCIKWYTQQLNSASRVSRHLARPALEQIEPNLKCKKYTNT